MRRPQSRLIVRVVRELVLQMAVQDLESYDWKELKKLRRQRRRVSADGQRLLARLGWRPADAQREQAI